MEKEKQERGRGGEGREGGDRAKTDRGSHQLPPAPPSFHWSPKTNLQKSQKHQ